MKAQVWFLAEIKFMTRITATIFNLIRNQPPGYYSLIRLKTKQNKTLRLLGNNSMRILRKSDETEVVM